MKTLVVSKYIIAMVLKIHQKPAHTVASVANGCEKRHKTILLCARKVNEREDMSTNGSLVEKGAQI